MNDDLNARCDRLESHVAHLEHLTEQLNAVVTEQGKQLDQLRRQLLRQAATIENIELERIKATNPKPPHYQ